MSEMEGSGTKGQTQYDFFFGVIYEAEKSITFRPLDKTYAKIGRETVDEDMLLMRAKGLNEKDRQKIQELIDAPSGWIYINNGHGIIVKVKNGKYQGFSTHGYRNDLHGV